MLPLTFYLRQCLFLRPLCPSGVRSGAALQFRSFKEVEADSKKVRRSKALSSVACPLHSCCPRQCLVLSQAVKLGKAAAGTKAQRQLSRGGGYFAYEGTATGKVYDSRVAQVRMSSVVLPLGL
eukprot:SAG22_NODE_4414_length_1278_cov_0.870229_2_plen_123_part_00